MTASALELLARCRSLGIDLSTGPDGALAWAAETDPPAELLAALGEHKAELLALLAPPDGAAVWVLPPGTRSAPIDGSCPGCAFCRLPAADSGEGR